MGLTIAVFLPALLGGFVGWDDVSLLVSHTGYRGLDPSHLAWMASNVTLGHYVPVVWLSFAVDYLLWGLNPVGYHLTNVVLHGVNAGLVFVLARTLIQRANGLTGTALDVGSATAALAFALHPLRVEAVAWVIGRRDLLCALWTLCALLAYLRAAQTSGRPRAAWLAGSWVAYGLALLSKAIVMTLPVGLLLLDVYPLRRLPADVRRWTARETRGRWPEKLPYVILAAGGAAVSYWGQARGSGVILLDRETWLGVVWASLWLHVQKSLAPVGLSPLYELPARIDPWTGRYAVAGLAVTGITLGLVALRRRWPAGLAAWIWYVALLAPTCALAHAGPQVTADRYSYLPTVGGAIVLGGGVGLALRSRRWTLVALAGLGLVGLVALTEPQIAVWRDKERLWRHAVHVTPDCGTCHQNLGVWLQEEERFAEALPEFERALAIRPEHTAMHLNVGLALAGLGRLDEAITHYEAVLQQSPGNITVRSNVAAALVRLGRRREAVAELRLGLRFNGPEEAAAYFRNDAAANPTRPIPRLGLALVFLARGDRPSALEQIEILRRLDPELAAVVTETGASAATLRAPDGGGTSRRIG